jgi:hypothetical protein
MATGREANTVYAAGLVQVIVLGASDRSRHGIAAFGAGPLQERRNADQRRAATPSSSLDPPHVPGNR